MAPRGIVLFAHGSRDPRWAEPLDRLAQTLQGLDSELRVATAFLELMTPTLSTAIAGLVAQGVTRLTVLPVFWASTGHVMRDLPTLVEQAKLAHPGLSIAVLPTLSELPGVLEAVAHAALSRQNSD